MPYIGLQKYAQFSEIMHKQYEQAVKKMREEISRGKTYEQACANLPGAGPEIRRFIREDFLRIIIAEEHFGAGIEIADIALFLDLPYEKVEAAKQALIDDMKLEAEYHQRRQPEKIN